MSSKCLPESCHCVFCPLLVSPTPEEPHIYIRASGPLRPLHVQVPLPRMPSPPALNLANPCPSYRSQLSSFFLKEAWPGQALSPHTMSSHFIGFSTGVIEVGVKIILWLLSVSLTEMQARLVCILLTKVFVPFSPLSGT
jgi:hypothetical protein